MKMYQVDAFSAQLFKGNPAAVIVLDQWLDEALMQSIAMENKALPWKTTCLKRRLSKGCMRKMTAKTRMAKAMKSAGLRRPRKSISAAMLRLRPAMCCLRIILQPKQFNFM